MPMCVENNDDLIISTISHAQMTRIGSINVRKQVNLVDADLDILPSNVKEALP